MEHERESRSERFRIIVHFPNTPGLPLARLSPSLPTITPRWASTSREGGTLILACESKNSGCHQPQIDPMTLEKIPLSRWKSLAFHTLQDLNGSSNYGTIASSGLDLQI